MPETRWKQALWDLLNVFSVRRATARIALSAGLLSLASSPAGGAEAQPRVPTMPAIAPEATIRRFKGRYVLRRAAGAFFVHLADHRSHSSHRSHGSHSSHSSHSSSSHYSGSHFSSAPSVPVTPVEPPPPPPRPVVEKPAPRPQPVALLRETFDSDMLRIGRWSVGVLATPPQSFDSAVQTDQTNNILSITPLAGATGVHFSGYLSQDTFDLATVSIASEVRRTAGSMSTIFAAGHDSGNWFGFRIDDGILYMESHTAGQVASRRVPYDSQRHRFVRLRMSDVAPVVMWETSANGTAWDAQYLETPRIQVKAVRIALSAGTSKAVDAAGKTFFDNVLVERKP